MIRCIPVDGSEPFEVPNDALVDRWERGEHIIYYANVAATTLVPREHTWTPRSFGRPVECRVESWRERAERIEKERDELASNILALIAKYSKSA